MIDPEIGPTAYRHGVHDSDMFHALRNAFLWWELDEGMEMHIGPSNSGMLLEIGVVAEPGGKRIVHAMPARSKFFPQKG